MKPILYESTATSFTTNGIGILNDAISCIVTQQRNGIYEAEIKYPMFGGIHFSELKMRSIVLVLPDKMSDPQPMRVYNISKPMRGVVTINCRHLAYDLMGIVAAPFEASSIQQAFINMKNAAVTTCPFTFWTDKTTAANMNVIEPSAIWSLLGGTEGSILDIYGGGEYEFDGYTVKLYQNRGYNRGVEIRYGKNLTDLDQEQNCESVYTGVYPYWIDQDGNLVQLSEKIVNASGTYDYTRIYPLDLSDQWEEAPTAVELRTKAQKYITDNNIGVPKVSLEVSFVSLDQAEEYKDLVLLEQVGLCDTVSVYFEKMDVTATAKVTEIRFNSILERYESVILGDAKTSLADTMAAQGQAIKNTKSENETFIRAAILSMTATILGAKGGSVRLLDTNNDGYPDTLYIADNDDPTLARKVWRFNYEGWGASSNGFNGPFTLGATLDGGIVADFITAGVLTADLIKAGLLSDSAGKNYWNMTTGEFSLSANTTVGGSTVSSIASTAASSAVNAQTQQSIFNKLTNNGQTQGIYLSNGKLYLNASYMQTGKLSANYINGGTLKLGGSNNTNGVLEVYNASGTKIGKWDKDGISASGSFTLQMDGYKKGGHIIGEMGVFNITDTTGGWNNIVSAQSTRGLRLYGQGNTHNEEIRIVPGSAVGVNGRTVPGILSSANLSIVSNTNGSSSYGQSSMNLAGDGGIGSIQLLVKNSANGAGSAMNYYPGVFNINYGPANSTSSFAKMQFRFAETSASTSFYINGSKSRLIETNDYGGRLLYCYETPTPYFGDIGEGQLDENGEAIICIDDIFKETVKTNYEYQVFLQKEGNGDLWVESKKPGYFSVNGTPYLKFAWELKARQKDFENERLEDVEMRDLSDNHNDALYNEPLFYLDSYQSYIEEQEEILYAETAQ